MKVGISSIKNRIIVVDTNIFVYMATAGFKERSGDLLFKLVEQGNSLVVSEITLLELFWEISDDTRERYNSILKSEAISVLPITTPTISNASILRREYFRYGTDKTTTQIKVSDLIIGATVSLVPKALLLTCDRSDFREPIWTSESYIGVHEATGDSIKENVYLLKINSNLISKKHKRKSVPRISTK